MSIFDMMADFVVKVGGWFFSWFGGDDRVKKVQARVVAMCGFLPTAQSVAAILAASNPVVTGIMEVAEAICRVVHEREVRATLISSPAPEGPNDWGTVNGVPVEGEFIK